jgi:signal transduction histidine kinase/ActR/RegA family two-component response regulator
LDVRRELHPGRDFVTMLCVCLLASVAVLAWPGQNFPALHTILNTCIFLVSGVLTLLLWDMGWRTGEVLARFNSIAFAMAGVLLLLHVLTALDLSGISPQLQSMAAHSLPGTWSPPAYLLPLGLGVAAWFKYRQRGSALILALGLSAAAPLLLLLFQWLPPYAPSGWLGITRPTLVLVPLLWIPVASSYWRRRHEDRIAHAVAFYGVIAAVANTAMLYSRAPADALAMIGHLGMLCAGLYLLFSLTQMGAADTARRMRAERDLSALNVALETRVRERTQELEDSNVALRSEMITRELAEHSALNQLGRLHLLHQITHAIGERQDLASIFKVVVGSLEDNLPVDLACICNFDPVERRLTVACVGARSLASARVMELTVGAQIPIDNNGLSRCVSGEFVYERDLSTSTFPFTRRLARGALLAAVFAPLLVEQRSGVLGVLLVARIAADSFSSGDCEFLNQLSENVALAANQVQLLSALQRAYDNLRDTQHAVMQQESLRALGQMASGIAHDINNAISPATLYVDSILERDDSLNARTRQQLETVQRAIGDVAQTVARMGEFYRQREPQLEMRPINVNVILDQVTDLTRARWSNMAQERGVTIELRIEAAAEVPTIFGIESEIREALINLVFNAADAMPKGGTITLRSRLPAANERSTSRPVFVEVCDDGTGMDETTRTRCLEPFFTTKGERGTGLGLAMVYGIAQRHGAELQIDSEPGKGTTMRLVFPAAAPAADSASHRAMTGSNRALRILIVDDDPLLLQSLRDALEYEGHEVFCSSGGQAGIDAFQASVQRQNPFPVVITDLGMPHIDGRRVAAAVKKAAPKTLVLMLTGWGQRLADSEDVPAHVDFVLNKPPNMWALREALTRVPNG